MGFTSIAFQGNEHIIAEGDLAVIMYLVGSHVITEDPPWLKEMRAEWLTQATVEIGYDLDLHLDVWASDMSRQRTIHEALQAVRIDLSQWTDVIPAKDRCAMQLHGPSPVEYYGDLPTASVVQSLDRISSLLLPGSASEGESRRS